MKRPFLIGIGIVLASAAGLFVLGCWAVSPLFETPRIISSTRITDRNGGLLYEISQPDEGVRRTAAADQIPNTLKQAIVAAEDARFNHHHGIDFLAIADAAADTLRRRETYRGASTLEQQVIKNLYHKDRPRTIIQKIRENLAAPYWSMTHSKNETFQSYANLIYFGNQAYGISAAADLYFHKPIEDLTLAESAMLAGIIPAPSAYDPYRHWSKAKERQQYVLSRMVKDGYITTEEEANALKADVAVYRPKHPIKAPHFVFRIIDELAPTYPDLETGGYTIRTTLDPELQMYAETAIEKQMIKLQDQHVTNAALLAANPLTGEILSYAGSSGYFRNDNDGRTDMITRKRQPGSSLKPFLYFTAFMQDLTPATVIADLPVRFETAEGKPYYPRNYGYRYFGPVSIRDALGSSLNIPAVKVLDLIGLPSFFGNLARFGIEFPEPMDHYGLGVVLGGGEVTLFDVTRAYASLALQARSVDFVDVLDIKDANSQTIYQRNETAHASFFEDARKAEQSAALISDILRDPLARGRSFGEYNLLDTGKEIAVKTGTTKDFRDNWAFGYTPDFVLGVWVGNADNTPMQGVTGITGAVPIWREVIMKRYRFIDRIIWPAPNGLITRKICATSGLLATDACPKFRTEMFIDGTEPQQTDDWYVRYDIDLETGGIKTDQCIGPSVQKTYLVSPAEYRTWQAAAKHEQPPRFDCTGRRIASDEPPAILSPLDGDVFERDELLSDQAQGVPFIAGGDSEIFEWRLNDQKITSSNATYLWQPQTGDYTLSLSGSDRQIHFTVR